MSWRLLAEVRDRDFNAVAKLCAEAKPKALPFNTVHGKLLMLLLAEWCDDDGLAVYQRSKAAFACASQISERQVQRLFAGFLCAGLIEIDRQADAQSKTPRLYRINIDRLAELPLTDIAKADRARRERKRQRTGDQQSGRGDQQSPQRDPDGHGRGDQQSGTGDQQSGTGDQQSPTSPIIPKLTLTPTAAAENPERSVQDLGDDEQKDARQGDRGGGNQPSEALKNEWLAWLQKCGLAESQARQWLTEWTERLGSDETYRRLQDIKDKGPNGQMLHVRMLAFDSETDIGHEEVA